MVYTGWMVSSPPRHRFWRWFYDRTAFVYDATLYLADRLRMGSEIHIRRQIFGGLTFASGAVVLDLGCGTAGSRPYLSREIHYIGVDASRGMLRRAVANCAEKQLRAAFVQADAHSLPFALKSLDLILAVGVLQHVDEPPQAIRKILRVVKPGAQLLLIDERRAQSRILTGLKPDDAQVQIIKEYFVLHLHV